MKLDLLGSKHTLFPAVLPAWVHALGRTPAGTESAKPGRRQRLPRLTRVDGGRRTRTWLRYRRRLHLPRQARLAGHGGGLRALGAGEGPGQGSVDNITVNFVHADVRQLRQAGINGPMQLIVNNGCLRNMNDDDRDSYVREVSAVAAPNARLLIVAFVPGGQFGVRGIDSSEMWNGVSHPAGRCALPTSEGQELDREKTPTRYYLFQCAA